MAEKWLCGRFEFSLQRPLLMGIVNVTPDSFSDGGHHATTQAAIEHARLLIKEGADILDIGGESTRPGSMAVSIDEELARVIPVIEGLRHDGIALSIDTCKPEVMQASLDVGADMINDVTGFRNQDAVSVVAQHATCGVCVMHMQGEPRTMQFKPHYDDVVGEIEQYLLDQAAHLMSNGVQKNRITLDPGLGFGKTVRQNFTLLRDLNRFARLDYPVLLGVSRKSMIGAITGRSVDQRVAGSIAAALAGVARGAAIVRVHDVAATKDALEVWNAVEEGGEKYE